MANPLKGSTRGKGANKTTTISVDTDALMELRKAIKQKNGGELRGHLRHEASVAFRRQARELARRGNGKA